MRALVLALLLLAGPALAADTTPFYRMAAPNILPNVTTTPQQFTLSEPAGATSYRFVNPCQVDVRIITVPDTSSTVTLSTGTLFLARTVEVLASSKFLSTPPTRIISIMAMSDPGATPCRPELTYGTGQ